MCIVYKTHGNRRNVKLLNRKLRKFGPRKNAYGSCVLYKRLRSEILSKSSFLFFLSSAHFTRKSNIFQHANSHECCLLLSLFSTHVVEKTFLQHSMKIEIVPFKIIIIIKMYRRTPKTNKLNNLFWNEKRLKTLIRYRYHYYCARERTNL